MVYRGKLSRACAECRAKKTRCDSARPSCGQCRRSGSKCSGYRNIQDLRLVDQTFDVTSKMSKHNARNSPEDSIDPRAIFLDPPYKDDVTEISIARAFPNPSFSLACEAECAFFAQYIHIGAEFTKTDFDFVAPVYGSAQADGMLADIVAALGILALARNNKDRSIMLVGAQKYTSALRQTQAALTDASNVKSDETLATVMLLALHESMTLGSATGEAGNSSIHLNGATKLLQLRGVNQFGSLAGRRMFQRLASQIMLSCLRMRKPLPPILLKLQRSGEIFLIAEELVMANLIEIAARLCKISSPELYIESTDSAASYRSLLIIDNDLARWALNLTPRYDILRVPGKRSSPGLPDHRDIYPTHIAAVVWNQYRCIRIETNERILQYLELIPATLQTAGEDLALQRRRAISCITTMSEDICTSVPFFLDGNTMPLQEESQAPKMTMYGSSAVIMPLCFAMNEKRISSAMYQWLIGQVKRVADDTGIAQARLLLAERRET